ncbi:MAG: NAD(P)H-quinone oxidoreductase [Gemmatimonadaceae bacterium]
MRAAVITNPGSPEVLQVREVARPLPAEREVLVRVHASALNRADLLQRQGKYPAPAGYPADIGGIEFAGDVVAHGNGASRWSTGDRVFGITGGGAHAEFLLAHEDTLTRIPAALSWTEAAAVPEAFITAYDAMMTQAGLRRGESVMIHAIGSGVGVAASQLARAAGARVFGTSRSADKLTRARSFGMDDGWVALGDLSSLGEAVRSFTAGRGIDVTLDLLGGPYLAASLDAAALQGRVMLIGTIAGPQSVLNLHVLLRKRLTLTGTVLRARPLAEKIAVATAFARDVVPLLEAGSVRPVVDQVYPLAEIARAHAAMESNETFGKVVITTS